MENSEITNELIRNVENEARKFFIGANGCHDWTHVERVMHLSLNIGKKEGADLGILELAVLLHDIGRKEEMENKGVFCHAEKGAEIATEILKQHNLTLNLIDRIIHCIKSHRFRKGNIPQTIEAKILYDADKIDSIGAIGIARDFLFAGNAGSKTLYTGNEKFIANSSKDYSYTDDDSAILEYEIKLKHIKDKMLTEEGRRIAQKRHDFMEAYFNKFWREVEGLE